MAANTVVLEHGLSFGGGWRAFLSGLGYEIEILPQRGFLARCNGRPVAMVHPWAEPEYFVRVDEMGRPAEGLFASDCHQHGVRYGIMACHNQYRLFDCYPSATTGEWLDLVEFYRLHDIDPSALPHEITEEDIGVVCWMAVLPPQAE